MNQLRNLCSAILLGCFMLSSHFIFAQDNRDNVVQLLADISIRMMKEGNEKFIVVEAMKDGIVHPDESFAMSYSNGVFTLNDKKLSGDDQAKYVGLMQDFNRRKKQTSSFSISTDGIKLSDVLDPNSSFRMDRPNPVNEKAVQKSFYEDVLKELANGGYIAAGDNVSFVYGKEGFFLNGEKLEGAIEDKLANIIKEKEGKDPLEGGISGSLTTTFN